MNVIQMIVRGVLSVMRTSSWTKELLGIIDFFIQSYKHSSKITVMQTTLPELLEIRIPPILVLKVV
jgi:hypothetical protein